MGVVVKVSLMGACLLVASSGIAANHCVRSDAAGANSGTTWTDAFTELPATLVRGDVYFVADGTYAGRTFNTAADGTNLVTVKKATSAAHGASTGWEDGYGDGQALFGPWNFTTPYWLMDGAVGGGPSAWTAGHGFVVRGNLGVNDNIVNIQSGSSNVVIAHVDVGNTEWPTPGCDRCIYSIGSGGSVRLSHCYFHNTGDVGFTFSNPVNWIFEYCRVDKVDRYGQVTECGTGTNHGAGWELSGTTTDFTIRYCFISNIEGSGWIGIYDTGSGTVNGLYIYGNVFANTPDFSGTWGNGVIYNVSGTTGALANVKIYNNTFANLNYHTLIGLSKDIGGSRENPASHGNEFVNNLVWNVAGTDAYDGAQTRQSNASDEVVAGDSAFQLLEVCPISESYALTNSTQAGDALAAPYSTDMFGTVRGADGVADRGAIEFSSEQVATGRIGSLRVGTIKSAQ